MSSLIVGRRAIGGFSILGQSAKRTRRPNVKAARKKIFKNPLECWLQQVYATCANLHKTLRIYIFQFNIFLSFIISGPSSFRVIFVVQTETQQGILQAPSCFFNDYLSAGTNWLDIAKPVVFYVFALWRKTILTVRATPLNNKWRPFISRKMPCVGLNEAWIGHMKFYG